MADEGDLMSDTKSAAKRTRMAELLSRNGLLGVMVVVLVVWFAMKFLWPATPVIAESGPTAPLDWVVHDIRTGEPMEMSQFKGEVLVLNFWATWCGPCRWEKPAIDRLHQAMADEGLKVLAVSLQEDPQTVAKYIDSNGYVLPVAVIPTAPPSAIDIPGVPTTYVINRRGEIVLKQVGAYTGWDGAEMTAQLRELLKG